MNASAPHKVLIAGGKPFGGVSSFAESLRHGFAELGIPAEVAAPKNILGRIGELRNPNILKILSLEAVFAAPVARRALCVSHGTPCAKYQGWLTTLAILASLGLATVSHGSKLVVVSRYSALQLEAIFALRVDGVIHNPVDSIFLESFSLDDYKREAITYVGRLHGSKNVDRILPAMRDVLNENPALRAWIIGDGSERQKLERLVSDDERFEFLGPLSALDVRERLRRSKVFVSANPTEPFGIVYVEALSQGCSVAMPASGGGMEIAPELFGSSIQLFSPQLEREEIASALRKALQSQGLDFTGNVFSPRAVAEEYLAMDSRFNQHANRA